MEIVDPRRCSRTRRLLTTDFMELGYQVVCSTDDWHFVHAPRLYVSIVVLGLILMLTVVLYASFSRAPKSRISLFLLGAGFMSWKPA